MGREGVPVRTNEAGGRARGGSSRFALRPLLERISDHGYATPHLLGVTPAAILLVV